MALSKETIISGMQLDNDKVVFVNEDTVIKEDDTEISRKSHRKVLNSDMDISAEDAEVKAVCNAVWTDAIKAAWKTQIESDPLGA